MSFTDFWQNLPSKMDPTIFEIGNFPVRYYGLMYILAFGTTYLMMIYRSKKDNLSYDRKLIEDFIFAEIVSVLLGGRLGYVLFYNLGYFIKHPLEIFLPFRFENGFQLTGISGMSYHGATIGAIIGAYIFCRKRKIDFWNMADFTIVVVPLGYTFGRLGNFINGELFGRVTDSSIGMYFPAGGVDILRHPSQLYEGFFEGFVLFLILWSIRNWKFIPKGGFLGLYLIGYGVFRFIIEYFREPDSHLGFVFLSFSMGQVLCFFMILLGVLWVLARKILTEKEIKKS
ncbi:MAG: prolipoprotein diacylglyceryl transferase [Candidatus Cloacimonadota bacterium]|nr:MAG: prolipoprotein diacylglyceryl transferase [Candidatus Cloacimonadota bacterium]PIE79946.1 MAG: prolipoprotein diacylglyceryl transferase [Candidatus Delongbacteria bacterium]